jgi:hypothetical protein
VDDEKIAVYGLWKDFHGRPIAILRWMPPGQIYQQAQRTPFRLVITFLVFCLVFSVVLQYALVRYLRSRDARREALDRYRAVVIARLDCHYGG